MPSVPPSARRTYQFGVFELDVYSRELRKAGVRLNVQDQPLQLLRLLLERPGDLVTREELRQQLWPSDTFVGFEHGLNAAVRRLRETLGDSADTPRFIETLPRRGYRFIGTISDDGDPAAAVRQPRDAAAELRRIAEVAELESSTGPRPSSWRRTAVRVVLPSAVIAGVIGGVVGLAISSGRPALPAPIVRTQLDVHPADDAYGGGSLVFPGQWTRGGSRTLVAWTPSGRTLVFVGRQNGVRRLYVRDLDHTDARPLAGTEDAQAPVVSPDGEAVVFWAKGAIIRMPLDGGAAQTLAAVGEPPYGMTIGSTGRLAFSDGRIWQVASGSAPIPVTTLLKGETAHLLPQWLPTDAVLLYTVRTSGETWGHERVVAQVLATAERKTLVEDAVDARYVPTGHLVFLRRGLLMAVPFDVNRVAVTGAPVALLDGIAQALASSYSGDITGAGHFSVSATGALAYVPSPVVGYPDALLATVDRQGRVSVLPGEPHSFGRAVHLSPDGHRLAVSIRTFTEKALWVADLTTGSLMKFTIGGEAWWPHWSPDGRHIAFERVKEGISEVVWQRADGSAPVATLASGFEAPSWCPDGRHVAVQKDGDLWAVTVGNGQPTLTRITETPEVEGSPEFSPDHHWMAYVSDKTGRPEVYVKPVSASTPGTLVSLASGTSPAWNPRGRELFFVEGSDPTERTRLMAVEMRDGRFSPPVPLFDVPPGLKFWCYPSRCYDVTPDGQRFITTKVRPRDPPPPVTHINLVLNWGEELKARVSVN